MFVQLKNLLENAAGLTLTISASDAELQVVVSPKAAQGSNSGLVRPLVLKGTPEELDEGFVNALSGFIKTRQTLSDQLAAAQADIEAEKKAAAAQAKEKKDQAAKTKSSSSAKPASKNKTSPPEAEEDEDDDPLFKSPETGSDTSGAQACDESGEGKGAETAVGVNIFSKEG